MPKFGSLANETHVLSGRHHETDCFIDGKKAGNVHLDIVNEILEWGQLGVETAGGLDGTDVGSSKSTRSPSRRGANVVAIEFVWTRHGLFPVAGAGGAAAAAPPSPKDPLVLVLHHASFGSPSGGHDKRWRRVYSHSGSVGQSYTSGTRHHISVV